MPCFTSFPVENTKQNGNDRAEEAEQENLHPSAILKVKFGADTGARVRIGLKMGQLQMGVLLRCQSKVVSARLY